MSQSCETLVAKINEWQKAVLELEKLTDVFLNSGNTKLKPEIDSTRQETKKLAEEYQTLAYPELSIGKRLFWPERELLDEAYGYNKDEISFYNYIENMITSGLVKLKDDHVNSFLLDSKQINLVLFSNLEEVFIQENNTEISDMVIEKYPNININWL